MGNGRGMGSVRGMTDEELIRRGDVRKAILEYLEETGSELERWDIDQIVSGIAAEDRIEELERELGGLLRVVTDNHVALQRAEAAEAKLTKAVEVLRKIGKTYSADGFRLIHSDRQIINMVYIVLAELEKQ
jgi:hypothetical protein